MGGAVANPDDMIWLWSRFTLDNGWVHVSLRKKL